MKNSPKFLWPVLILLVSFNVSCVQEHTDIQSLQSNEEKYQHVKNLGKSGGENSEEISLLLNELANDGFIEAQLDMAKINNVATNYPEAFKWFDMAAKQGSKEAQNRLGKMYAQGLGVEQNFVEAFTLFQKSALQGYSEAESNLGVLYLLGQGTPENLSEGMKWIQMSAQHGYQPAQAQMGAIYKDGYGNIKPNISKAKYWFKELTKNRNSEAMRMLGALYESEGNLVEAYKWYSLGEALADQESLSLKDKLELRMTPSSIEQAQNSSTVCYQSDFQKC